MRWGQVGEFRADPGKSSTFDLHATPAGSLLAAMMSRAATHAPREREASGAALFVSTLEMDDTSTDFSATLDLDTLAAEHDAQGNSDATAEGSKAEAAAGSKEGTETHDHDDGSEFSFEDEAEAGKGEEDAGGDAGDKQPEADKADAPKEGEEQEAGKRKIPGSARWRERALQAEAALRAAPPIRNAEDLNAAIERRLGPAPTPEDPKFKGDYLAFERAATAYATAALTTAPALKEAAAQAEQLAQAAEQDRFDAFQAAKPELRKALPDFDTVMAGASKVEATPQVLRELLDSEKSALLTYHLVKNPAVVAKLNTLSGRELVKEVGRLEATVNLPQARKISKAPAPVTPPRGSAATPRDQSKLSSADIGKMLFG